MAALSGKLMEFEMVAQLEYLKVAVKVDWWAS